MASRLDDTEESGIKGLLVSEGKRSPTLPGKGIPSRLGLNFCNGETDIPGILSR